MTETTSPDSRAAVRRRVVPLLLLFLTLTSSIVVAALAPVIDGSPLFVRDALASSVLLVGVGGYAVTRLGKGRLPSSLIAGTGLVVGAQLMLVPWLNGFGSRLSIASAVLGVVSVLTFGLLLWQNSRT